MDKDLELSSTLKTFRQREAVASETSPHLTQSSKPMPQRGGVGSKIASGVRGICTQSFSNHSSIGRSGARAGGCGSDADLPGIFNTRTQVEYELQPVGC